MRFTISLFLGLGFVAMAAHEPAATSESAVKENPSAKESKEPVPSKIVDPVVREYSVGIDGKKVPYKVTTGKIQLKKDCLLYTSPSPRDRQKPRMPSSA